MSDAVAASVVVCTNRPWEAAKTCLASLFKQTLTARNFEILVVDNMSQPRRPPDGFIPRSANITIRWLHEPRAGLSHARNLGAAQARSEIVAYIDDDAEATPFWLENLVKVFTGGPGTGGKTVGCVGGPIRLSLPEKPPRWYDQSLDGWWGRFEPPPDGIADAVEYSALPYGGNLAIRKSLWAELGGFDVSTGRGARPNGSQAIDGGEEIDFCLRAARAGRGIRTTPGAVVLHHVGPERLTIKYLWRQSRVAGLSLVRLDESLTSAGALRRGLVQLLKCAYPFRLMHLGRRLNHLLRGRMFLIAARHKKAANHNM